MTDDTSGSFEYPDEAGYPDGTGTLSETQQVLVDEVKTTGEAQPGIDFFVVENPETKTYDAVSGDTLVGGITYERQGDVITLIATSVFPEFRGQGVATALIRRVLDTIRSEGLLVKVQCPIVKTFIDAHDEYATLLDRS
ncbi:GNAT family N-acetyltransferase [Leifsonia sp. fls2-241-R2A-40a]|uniref:GNAT family N-acetyltransferase n=1 Tax=Leifsonia sp. fls2-241-R2A-40a TaxID=3040290 RepID=UPI0025502BF8|nr:GNAT family N-acetyltransferase [Leifsonia sp. fls2-241-R2A-40a]